MKKPAVGIFCVSLLAMCLAIPVLSLAQTVANKQSVINQARQSYYNVRGEGLLGFECSLTPNWELLLQQQSQQNPEAADAALKALSNLHFMASLASGNTVKLTHNDLAGQSEKMRNALKDVYGSMEQLTSGFFDVWNMFTLDAPFPEANSDYRLEAAGTQYRLSYREGLTDVATTMGRDFAISSRKVTTPESDSSIQPTFTRTPEGFLLTAYEENYRSQKPDKTIQLKVALDYQQIEGIQMLQKLRLAGAYDGAPFAVELTFSDCKVTKRSPTGT